ncbi:MAG: hypothetical protein Q9212_006121 [Teloschistes hypoglaucus]
MKNRRHQHKKPKDQNLQKQAPQNDILAQLRLIRVCGCHYPPATGLDEESEDIADDEDFRDPARADEGEGCGVRSEYEAVERHVYCGGEEGGGDENEERLD